jgi:hypothetical protein
VSTNLVDECYRRAQEAKRAAEMASMPSQKTHFLGLEQRWLRGAKSVAAKTVRETNLPIALWTRLPASACAPSHQLPGPRWSREDWRGP